MPTAAFEPSPLLSCVLLWQDVERPDDGGVAFMAWSQTMTALFASLGLILFLVLTFFLARRWMESRAEARADVVRLLEEAIKSPAADRAAVERLAEQLAGGRAAAPGPRLLFGIGWIMLFAGAAAWVLASDPDWEVGGICGAVLGFGLVTYPFALRELDSRREPS